MTTKAIVHDGGLLIADEVKFAYDVPTDTERRDAPVEAHLYIEFKHGGSIRLKGLTAEGLARLINGDPF
jgi:hypothetical protein